MLVPLMPLTEKVLCVVRLEMLPLAMLHAPVLAVVQLTDDPPAVKPPLTTAADTATPLASLTATVTLAAQPLLATAELPASDATDTIMVVDGGGTLPLDVLA